MISINRDFGNKKLNTLQLPKVVEPVKMSDDTYSTITSQVTSEKTCKNELNHILNFLEILIQQHKETNRKSHGIGSVSARSSLESPTKKNKEKNQLILSTTIENNKRLQKERDQLKFENIDVSTKFNDSLNRIQQLNNKLQKQSILVTDSKTVQNQLKKELKERDEKIRRLSIENQSMQKEMKKRIIDVKSKHN